jgi:hypothetical protein
VTSLSRRGPRSSKSGQRASGGDQLSDASRNRLPTIVRSGRPDVDDRRFRCGYPVRLGTLVVLEAGGQPVLQVRVPELVHSTRLPEDLSFQGLFQKGDRAGNRIRRPRSRSSASRTKSNGTAPPTNPNTSPTMGLNMSPPPSGPTHGR